MATLTYKEVSPAKIKIPTDRNKIVIECSNCGKALFNVLPTHKADLYTTFVVDCCFCGDKSYEQTVPGLLSWFPENFVSILDMPLENGVVHVKTKRSEQTYDR